MCVSQAFLQSLFRNDQGPEGVALLFVGIPDGSHALRALKDVPLAS